MSELTRVQKDVLLALAGGGSLLWNARRGRGPWRCYSSDRSRYFVVDSRTVDVLVAKGLVSGFVDEFGLSAAGRSLLGLAS